MRFLELSAFFARVSSHFVHDAGWSRQDRYNTKWQAARCRCRGMLKDVALGEAMFTKEGRRLTDQPLVGLAVAQLWTIRNPA